MIKNVYAVYDEKADVFGSPILFNNDAEAERSFSVISADKQTTIGMHPADFAMYRIGVYDDHSGFITPENPVLFVARASQFGLSVVNN